jgi:hypothetical protein
VAIVLFPASGNLAECAAMASPFFGVGYFSAMIGAPGFNNYEQVVAAAIFWCVVYFTAAGGLLAATLLTFDRCLGRVPDRPVVPRLRPSAWDVPETDRVLGRAVLTQPGIVVDVRPTTVK